jgi:L-aminopeptidase/D-esterase-like protein
LERHSANFSKIGPGRVVSVSPTTNAIEWSIYIEGLTNCGRLVLSPSRQLAAIACSSKFQKTNGIYKLDPSTSDIVVFDATTTPIKELRRLGVAQRLDAGITKNISFASENIIFAIASGGNSTPGDRAFAVNATNGEITNLLEATEKYVLNGIYCSPGNGDWCLLTDAEQGKLHRWKVNSDHTLTPQSDVIVDTLIGLPPQTIGGL